MKKLLNIAAEFFAMFIIAGVLTIALQKRQKPVETKSVNDTVIIYDTVKVRKVIPVDSAVIRYVTVKLPVANTLPKDSIKLGELDTDSLLEDIDSAQVILPISQVEYKDSLYHAWISGFNPRLDSIDIYNKGYQITKTVMEKPKRWSFGIQAGAGVRPNSGFGAYIGLGVQYNIFSW